jgi:hypothetical protein
VIGGPWSGHADATGQQVVGLFAMTGLLFALSYKYVARVRPPVLCVQHRPQSIPAALAGTLLTG